jgi:hypothetical protein
MLRYEYGSKIMRVNIFIGAISSFGINIKSASEGVWFGNKFARSKAYDKVKGRKEL